MPDFLQALHSGRILLMDGAMGTELQRAGIQPGECYELWNLTHPQRVQTIHQAYVDAGAKCLLTNTFQANSISLARFGLADQLETINRAAIHLARSARGNPLVLASVGPFHVEDNPNEFDRVIRSLGGADGVLLETWSDSFETAARRAVNSVANPGRLPVLLSLTYWKPPGAMPCLLPSPLGRHSCLPADRKSCLTPRRTPREAAELASTLGISALGVNCGREIEIADIAAILRAYRAATDLPLFARPNAGTPTASETGWVYHRTPEQMAAEISELIQAGAGMIGGCCGTTPAHIVAFSAQLDVEEKRKGPRSGIGNGAA